MKDWRTILGTMRLPFVILAPVCALVGLGTAYATTGQVRWAYFVLAMIGATSAHISDNVFN